MAAVAERLKQIMAERGLKQVDVIRLAEPIGALHGIRLGKSHISQYVSGKSEPRWDILKVLAEALEVDPLWLQGEDAPAQPPSRPPEPPSGAAPESNRKDAERAMENGVRTFSKSSKLDNVLYDVRGPVVEEARRMEENGMNILKLNIGNPAPFGFRTPDEVIYDMRQQLPECEGYSDSRGLFSARKAIMQYAQLKNLPDVTINDIYTGNGVSELINLSMQALLDEGDEILIPSPDYPLWTATATLAGGKVVHYICDEQADWNPDIDDIKRKITSRTKAIVIILSLIHI